MATMMSKEAMELEGKGEMTIVSASVDQLSIIDENNNFVKC